MKNNRRIVRRKQAAVPGAALHTSGAWGKVQSGYVEFDNPVALSGKFAGNGFQVGGKGAFRTGTGIENQDVHEREAQRMRLNLHFMPDGTGPQRVFRLTEALGILLDEVAPVPCSGATVTCGDGGNKGVRLKVMAVSHAEGIARIEVGRHRFGADSEYATEHGGHLLFAGLTVSRDGHLDFHGRVFVDGNVTADGCCDSYALCPAKFKHALNILPKKRGFDGQLVRLETVDNPFDPFINPSQLGVHVCAATQVDNAHRDELYVAALCAYDAVSQ